MGKIIFRLRSALNKDVSIYVYLRGSGKQIETKTGYSFNTKYWNEDNSKPIRSHSLYSDVTRLVLYLLGRINEASEVGTNIDSRWLKKQLNDHFNRVDGDKDPLLVLNFFNDFITKSLAECEAGVGMKRITIRGYRTFYNILLEYEEDIGESIRFDKLDKFFFEDFYSWMLQEKKYKPSNINRHISRLKSICREAASYGTTVNPMYASFKTKKINQQRYLTIITTKEYEQIKAYEPSEKYLINARKWLLIGLCIGQRVSDLLILTNKNIRRHDGYCLVDVQQKKTGTPVTIPVKDPYVLSILYDSFPHSISSQRFNDYIKEVCKRSGINAKTTGYIRNSNMRDELHTGEKWMFISSHDLRRSFATNYFNSGVPVSLLMRATGHSRQSTFFQYIGHIFSNDESARSLLEHL